MPWHSLWTVPAMSAGTTYRSAELAARMERLDAAADGFHLDAVDHGATFAFTSSLDAKAIEQGVNMVSINSNLRFESDYTLAYERECACGDRLDVASSAGSGRRRLGCARPPAPVAETADEGEGGAR